MHSGLSFRQSVWVLAFSVVGGRLALSSRTADNPLIDYATRL
jgi:hypothetical protein